MHVRFWLVALELDWALKLQEHLHHVPASGLAGPRTLRSKYEDLARLQLRSPIQRIQRTDVESHSTVTYADEGAMHNVSG